MLAIAMAGVARGELKGQDKLMAQRAAKLDAIRQLAERIMGLTIQSATRVRDFVTEDDKIRTDMNHFIRGMKETDVRVTDADTVEVDMQITLKQIITKLLEIHKAYYKGGKLTASDFEKMTQTIQYKVIKVTGEGTVKGSAGEVDGEDYIGFAEQHPTKVYHKKVPAAWADYKGQPMLLAKRAAKVDAYRNLAERIMGLYISSTTKVRDFVTESDEINAEFKHYIRGVKFGEAEYADDLTCRIEGRVTLKTVITKLVEIHKRYYKGGRVTASDFTKMTQDIKYKNIVEYGQGTINLDRWKGRGTKKKSVIRKKTVETEEEVTEDE